MQQTGGELSRSPTLVSVLLMLVFLFLGMSGVICGRMVRVVAVFIPSFVFAVIVVRGDYT